MRRFRSICTASLVVAALSLALSATIAWGLTAADEAFLNKKIIARWVITGKGQIAEAYHRGIDILEDHPNAANGFFKILVTPEQLADLQAAGFKIDVEDYDWYRTYSAKTTETMGGFHTWSEGVAAMDSIHQLDSTLHYPNMITTAKFSIGPTYEGRPMWAMKVSDNPNVDEDEPEIFLNGMHHAREAIGQEICLETLRRLVSGYGTDTLRTRLVNEREIWFLPCVNPDGYEKNRELKPNGGGQWRKNRSQEYIGGIGVDLNRNYGYEWGYDNEGSSPDPGSEVFRGSGPFSEPETDNMRTFVNSRHFVIALNFHAYSNLFLWPWGYRLQWYTPDNALFEAMCDSAAKYNGCTPEVSSLLYVVNGDSDDWGYGATGEHTKILSITPEVGSGADGFWPPVSRIPILVEDHMASNLVFIDLAGDPEHIFPPAVPDWIAPTSSNSPDFTLVWKDSGESNPVVTFHLNEVFGIHRVTDGAEATTDDWHFAGFSRSTTRASAGSYSYWGGTGNSRIARMAGTDYLHVQTGDTLRMKLWYDTEENFDYAYVEVSTDHGQDWTPLSGNVTTTYNPYGGNRGNGITGTSGGFVAAKFPLAAYIGQDVLFRLSYETDDYTVGAGIYADEIDPLTDYDSTITLAAAMPETTFAVTGKASGEYWYSLSGADADGQTMAAPPHKVTVSYSTCSCPCHADPQCDSIVSVQDVVLTVNVAFRGAASVTDPGCPRRQTDVNCDGVTTVADVVKVVNVAFRSGSRATNFCDPCAP